MSTPRLRLEPREVVRTNSAWRIRWRVTNHAGAHVRVVAVRAPHARFRSEPVDLDTVVADIATVEHNVRIEAAPGEEIADALVALVVVQDRETWRVHFSVRVRVAPDGTPTIAVEGSTVERVGVSDV